MLSGPLLINDGSGLRPLTVALLGYDTHDLIDSAVATDLERLLYPAEAELLERIAGVLGRPPSRRAGEGPALWLSRDDVAVLGHALEVLGRIRVKRLEQLAGTRPASPAVVAADPHNPCHAPIRCERRCRCLARDSCGYGT